jgi:hypothetical protein
MTRRRGEHEHRVENPGWNITKSAFADYALGTLRQAGNRARRTEVSMNVRDPHLSRG